MSHPLGFFAAMDSLVIDLGLACAVVAVALAVLLSGGARTVEAAARRLASRRVALVVSLVAAALAGVFATSVLDCFPNSADEYGYRFLADTLRQGRLWNPAPLEAAEFFDTFHVARKEGRWVSRFMPGYPLVLVAAGWASLPGCLVNPVLFGGLLLMVSALVRRLFGSAAAVASVVLTAGCGFSLFTAASWRSHTLAALLLVWLALALHRLAEGGRAIDAVQVGAAFGLAVITRPFTAVVVAAPLLAWIVWAYPRRLRSAAPWIVLGGLPTALFLVGYNLGTTGSPWQLVTTWMDPQEGLGFVKGHSPREALGHLARRFGMWFEWSVPTVLPVALLALGSKRLWRERSIVPFALLSLPGLAVGHFFYYAFGGTQYGPRFFYEAYPFVVLAAVAVGWDPAGDSTRRKRVRWVLAGGLAFALAALPFTAARLNRVVDERQDLYRLVERSGLENAIVLIASKTGREWPMNREDLTRNGVDLGGSVLYALSLGGRNDQLFQAFPERSFFLYVRREGSPRGTLEPLRVGAP